MRRHPIQPAVTAVAIALVSACGPAQEQRGTTTAEEHRGPSETLHCSPGLDPIPHVAKLQPWLPPNTTPEVVLETRPIVDDITGDGLDDLIFFLRAAENRFIGLVGCQDSIVTGLGVYRLEGLEGVVELDKIEATGIPPGEIRIILTRREPPAQYEWLAFLRFDGASLNSIFAYTRSNVPPTGHGTRAEASFLDRNADGMNEAIVMEETLDGETARARNTDPTAPLARVLGTRQVRFEFNRDRGTYILAESLRGRGAVSTADITAQPSVVSLTDAGAGADAGPAN